METTTALTVEQIETAPEGTFFSFTTDEGHEHLCTIEGWNEEYDGAKGYIVCFLFPWTLASGFTIQNYYTGVPATRLSTPSDTAVYDAMERAERDAESVEEKLWRMNEELSEARALATKLAYHWNSDESLTEVAF